MTVETPRPRISRYGEESWLVAFDAPLGLDVNARVHALAAEIRRRVLPGVRDIVPAATSLVVHADADLFDGGALEEAAAVVPGHSSPARPPRLHEIPVCYDPPFAPDLEDVARACGCAEATVVERHLACQYQVLMLGFLPGFPYLGLVDERIAAPRKATPRRDVPAGSVGIAGRQTGIYPCQSPGGWQIIGRTPCAMFDPGRPAPARLAPGDRVRFVRIDAARVRETDPFAGW